MFPFSTDKYYGTTKITLEEFAARLENNILKNVMYETDGNFYGKIDVEFAKFELGIKPRKDASRPVVVMKWKKTIDKISIQTKCRLDNSVHFMTSLWLALGIYMVIQDKDIKSIVPIITFSIFVYFILFVLYSRQKIKTTKKLKELLSKLEVEEDTIS